MDPWTWTEWSWEQGAGSRESAGSHQEPALDLSTTSARRQAARRQIATGGAKGETLATRVERESC